MIAGSMAEVSYFVRNEKELNPGPVSRAAIPRQQPKTGARHLSFNLTTEVYMADAARITVQELKRRMDAGDNFTVIDTRNPKAWAEADTVIPGATRLPAEGFESILSRIPKNKPVVAYCT